jgi:NAD(P)-dependent dehydrogenase (short-subunit alcohol dehydrogenase family)
MPAKRILITGAASGIGAATMAELGRRGQQVIGLDVNAEGESLIRCDVRDQGSVDEAVGEAIERLGGLDVVINNAGLATPQSAGRAPDERALAVLDVNMVGPWRVTCAALPALRRVHGRVVNVASGMAFVALPFSVSYAKSKHGVVAYSQALRLEYGDEIDVTTVYPGVIDTPIHRDSEEFRFTIRGTSPTEKIEDAVNALTRAALDESPSRDITTTRSGLFLNGLSRHAPRRFVDWVILRSFRKNMKGRDMGQAAPPLAEFAARLAGSDRRR